MDTSQEEHKYNFSTTINMNTNNTSKNKHNKLTINNNVANKSQQTKRIDPSKTINVNNEKETTNKWNTRFPRNINWTKYN